MAIPLKVKYDATGKPCGLAEFEPTDAFSVSIGGTGGTTPEEARENLGVYSKDEVDALVTGTSVVYVHSNYTAKDKERILVDTRYDEITITLPDLNDDNTDKQVIIISDADGNAQNKPITVDLGTDDNFIIDVNNAEVTFVSYNYYWHIGV